MICLAWAARRRAGRSRSRQELGGARGCGSRRRGSCRARWRRGVDHRHQTGDVAPIGRAGAVSPVGLRGAVSLFEDAEQSVEFLGRANPVEGRDPDRPPYLQKPRQAGGSVSAKVEPVDRWASVRVTST
jgi:hypothetical protein